MRQFKHVQCSIAFDEMFGGPKRSDGCVGTQYLMECAWDSLPPNWGKLNNKPICPSCVEMLVRVLEVREEMESI